MTSAPLISVIVPTFNRAALLPATLETLTRQTIREPYEVIVVDDGSVDATREAVAAFTGCVVRYERIEHAGLPAPINRGLEAARGRYAMLANDHDLYEPQMLEALAEALDAHPKATLAVCDVVLVTPDASRELDTYSFPYAGAVDGRRFILDRLLPGLGTIAPHNMFRVEALRCERLDASFGASTDVELWLRLASRGDVVHVPEILVRVRERDEGSAHFYTNHRLVREALRAKRAYLSCAPSVSEQRAITAGWRRRVDRSAAASLLRALEGGHAEEKAAIREVAREEGTLVGRLAVDTLTRLPDAVALAALRGLRSAFGGKR